MQPRPRCNGVDHPGEHVRVDDVGPERPQDRAKTQRGTDDGRPASRVRDPFVGNAAVTQQRLIIAADGDDQHPVSGDRLRAGEVHGDVDDPVAGAPNVIDHVHDAQR